MHWYPRELAGRLAFVLAPLAAMTITTVAVAAAADEPTMLMTRDDAQLGTLLTDAKGMTLYLFTKDAPGISNCYDQCATNWPPLLTSSDSVAPDGLQGVLGTTPRNDGTRQVTYNGMPLYYWARDANPGDTTGQNVGGVWFVINPASALTVNLREGEQLGKILTDARGMTLYMFTKDAPNVSNCYDQCATNWPPLTTAEEPTGPDDVSSALGLTPRTDGSQQVTYNGMPLYYWAANINPGDTTGQNVGGVWFVVNP